MTANTFAKLVQSVQERNHHSPIQWATTEFLGHPVFKCCKNVTLNILHEHLEPLISEMKKQIYTEI